MQRYLGFWNCYAYRVSLNEVKEQREKVIAKDSDSAVLELPVILTSGRYGELPNEGCGCVEHLARSGQ